MDIYGPVEVQYYGLTDTGINRIKSNNFRGLGVSEKQILKEIGELDGKAEWDELKTYSSFDSPTVLAVSLRRLVDLGLVAPIIPQATQ